MADEDAENIGGISVSIGASHSQLASDLAAAERQLQAWVASHKIVVPIGASFTAPQGQPAAQQRPAPPPPPARAATPPPISYRGASAPTPAFVGSVSARDRLIQDALNKEAAALGKTAGKWNAVTGEVEDATKATREHRQAVVGVQQVASRPTEAGIDFGPTLSDAQTLLATMREIVAEAVKLAAMPAPKVAAAGSREREEARAGRESAERSAARVDRAATGGGGGKRPKGRAAASAGDDEDGEDKVVLRNTSAGAIPADENEKLRLQRRLDELGRANRIQYVDRVERQRRQAAGAGFDTVGINRSEQEITRQRERETSRAEQQRQRDAAASRRAAASNNRQASTQRLEALTADAAADASARGQEYIGAQPFTQARRAEVERARRAAAAAPPPAPPPGVPPDPERGARLRAIRERGRQERLVRAAVRADQARDEEVFARAAPDKAAERERRIEETIARARSNITASGRTGRTAGSGIGALLGGTQGRLIEANARLAASDKAVAEAAKAALPFRRRIAEYDEDIATSSKEVATSRRETKKAFEADPKTIAVLEQERKALLGQRDALRELNKLQSGGNIVRNLAAISLGGAAFGVGLKAVDFLVDQVSKGLSEFIEIQTGFGATSTRVTMALGQQTLALHGNADAAIAAATAQAGISSASSDALSSQLKLTTQIKAGVLAQQQASELFRSGFGVGNAPSGLFGSFGGVGGTGLFGQKGFTQQVQTDVSAFTQGRGNTGTVFDDILANFSRGVDYLNNPDFRAGIDAIAEQKGVDKPLPIGVGFGAVGIGIPAPSTEPAAPFQETNLTQEGRAYLNNLNDAARRGADALGEVEAASYRTATSQDEIDQAIKSATAAGDVFGVRMAAVDGVVLAFGKTVVGAGKDVEEAGDAWQRAAEQVAVGTGIADPAQLAKAALFGEQLRQRESAASLEALRARQQFEMPSIIGGIDRQRQFVGQQQSAQFTVGALTNPNLPVGTGIAPEDQARVADSLAEANDLQDQLNDQYEEGRQIIADTYRPAIVKNFGAAAATAFDTALNAVETTGKRIAEISADLSNEQAAYQVAQYNFQLHIAQRSLRDIAGLTGGNFGVESSRLGLLQRENLELSRQGQQLQFQMSQRQINFRVALAGFQAPGVTPEERQANVKAAQIEASFAQKQLDIQRKMFGNQVKIVDISNLRQGRDLMKQIGLLQQGRAVQIDTAAAEQKLQRLNQLQQRNVQKVGTYLSAVDNVVGVAMGNIQQLEAAAGEAMTGLAQDVLAQFGIFIEGLSDAMTEGMKGPVVNQATGFTTGTIGGGTGGGGGGTGTGTGGGNTITPTTPAPAKLFAIGTVVTPNGSPHELTAGEAMWERTHGIDLNGNGFLGYAKGIVGTARGRTSITVGEAGNETVAILRNPRPFINPEGGFGGGGGMSVVINFNGPIGVRSEDDIEAISRKVQQALGRTAATKGLRTL